MVKNGITAPKETNSETALATIKTNNIHNCLRRFDDRYSKICNNTGVCVVTTGPATTNALTGLLSAWQDSVPVIFISGQTRKEQTSYGKKVRQRGSQECNILDAKNEYYFRKGKNI